MHTTHADCPSISAAALFDHRVVGTMSHEEAVTVGTELDHSHVSRGGRWSRIFAQKTRRYRPMSNRTGPWPMIAELDGYIFCDVDVRR